MHRTPKIIDVSNSDGRAEPMLLTRRSQCDKKIVAVQSEEKMVKEVRQVLGDAKLDVDDKN